MCTTPIDNDIDKLTNMERIIINQVCAGQISIMMNKGSVVQICKR